jgi:hypothetical protein
VIPLPSLHRLTATTATGLPVLSVVDYSIGGLLVEASEPFGVGSVAHLHLSTPDGRVNGTFALRCLHTHRTIGPEQAVTHISALVFVHPLDEVTREALSSPGPAERDHVPAESRHLLRLVRSPTD